MNMKKIISKEVVYDKETPINFNLDSYLIKINGSIRTVIYKITYKKRRLFSKKDIIEIDYKIKQWIPEIHGIHFCSARDKAEEYLYELVRKSKFDAEVYIKKYEYVK